jgi:hypothetical protein
LGSVAALSEAGKALQSIFGDNRSGIEAAAADKQYSAGWNCPASDVSNPVEGTSPPPVETSPRPVGTSPQPVETSGQAGEKSGLVEKSGPVRDPVSEDTPTELVGVAPVARDQSPQFYYFLSVVLAYTTNDMGNILNIHEMESGEVYLIMACADSYKSCACAYKSEQSFKPRAEKGGGLSTGAKVGISLAAIGLLGLLAVVALCCCCRGGGVLAARRKAGTSSSSASAGDVEAPHAGAGAATGVEIAGGAAAAVGAAAVGAAAAKKAKQPAGPRATRVKNTIRSPNRVSCDPATTPVTDAEALRDGASGGGVIAADGALPIHLSVALDTSQLGCSAEHDDGDVRGQYAAAVERILSGMGGDVQASLVTFSGDDAAVSPAMAASRITRDPAVIAAAVATAGPPAGAAVTRASPKAAMRAVNMCIGLLRETEPGRVGAKRVFMLTGGGISDSEMQQLRSEANGGRGWKTANCVVVGAVGSVVNPPAVVQLGAVAVEADTVDMLATPDSIRVLKSLFAADDPRTVG